MSDQIRRVGVVLGGASPEREISLRTGEAVLTALRERGYEAVAIHADRHLDLGVRQAGIDAAFIALHGRGADGPVQGLLESLGIPYTGSSLAASALATDKLKSKELLRLHNLPTPSYYCHSRGMGSAVEQHGAFGYPCLVKPRAGGTGIGFAIARDAEELEAAVDAALRFDDDVVVERHLPGREVQVAILDGQVLGAAEVIAERGVPGRTQMVTPPRLGPERLRGVVTQAVRAHHLLGCDGATRVDIVVSDRGNESILEIEPFPSLADGALLPRLAVAAGLVAGDLIEHILLGARLHAGRRMRERRGPALPWTGSDRRTASVAESH